MRTLIAAFVLAAVLLLTVAVTDVPQDAVETETLLALDVEHLGGVFIEDARSASCDYEAEMLLAESEVLMRAARATRSVESIVTDYQCTHGEQRSHGLMVRRPHMIPRVGSLALGDNDADRTEITRGPLSVGVIL